MAKLVTKVPCLVDSTGSKGWTVLDFASASDAANFVSERPDLALPCWKRFSVVDGALTLAK